MAREVCHVRQELSYIHQSDYNHFIVNYLLITPKLTLNTNLPASTAIKRLSILIGEEDFLLQIQRTSSE